MAWAEAWARAMAPERDPAVQAALAHMLESMQRHDDDLEQTPDTHLGALPPPRVPPWAA